MIKADTVKGALAGGAERGGEAIKQLTGDKGSVSAINAIFASAAVNALGGTTDPTTILARQSGSILNPNMELLFGGVQLRSFRFEFDLETTPTLNIIDTSTYSAAQTDIKIFIKVLNLIRNNK